MQMYAQILVVIYLKSYAHLITENISSKHNAWTSVV